MTEDILQAIKKKAEEKYPLGSQWHNAREQEVFTSGCIEGIELMKGFDKWKVDNGYLQYGYKWSKKELPESNDEVFTTEQLLSEYIKQLNK